MARQSTKRTRLVVDVSPELRRRIKVAAAERDITIRQYVVDALESAVAPDARPQSLRGRPVTKETIEYFRQMRGEMMQGRVFTDDSADLINHARDERTAEIERWANPSS